MTVKVETAAEQLLFSTLRIEAQGRVGTGTIVSHKWGDGKEGPFLVTNRHVIAGTQEGRITFTLAGTADESPIPLLGQSHSLTFGDAAWRWTEHPSAEIDIAVLPLGPAINQVSDKGVHVFYKSIPTDLVPKPDDIAEFDAVEEVLFVGYPSGLYDKANNLPIARKGITATPSSVDYEAKPVFLIDASVFPGSSGSPVFLYNIGAWSARDGVLRSGQRLFWLGVLGSVYLREDDSVLRFHEIPAAMRPVLKTQQMIDLGIVYKAHTAVETIEHLLRERGLLAANDGAGAAES